MDDLIPRLRTLAAKAEDLGQQETAREILALVQKISAKYYFMVQPGGYGTMIPDREYVEFPNESTVVDYVRDTLLSEGTGSVPGEQDARKETLDFKRARQMLLNVGEFGNLSVPLTPPDTLKGSKQANNLERVKRQLQKVIQDGQVEIIDGVEIDVATATMVLKFLASVNPTFAGAAMAMGLASVIHQAYDWFFKKDASTQRYSDLGNLKEELEERFERWKYDPRFQDVILKVVQAMTPHSRAQLMAENLPEIIDKAMEVYKGWKQEPEGTDLEAYVKDRESTFFKRVLPPKDIEDEEWAKSLP